MCSLQKTDLPSIQAIYLPNTRLYLPSKVHEKAGHAHDGARVVGRDVDAGHPSADKVKAWKIKSPFNILILITG